MLTNTAWPFSAKTVDGLIHSAQQIMNKTYVVLEYNGEQKGSYITQGVSKLAFELMNVVFYKTFAIFNKISH